MAALRPGPPRRKITIYGWSTKLTFADALARAREREPWVFEDTISAATTLIYGRSNVGKSYLVASMLLSLMIPDREFLGMQPVDPDRVWRPAIIYTDPGTPEEYAERLAQGVPPGVDLDVPMFQGRTERSPTVWADIAEDLVDREGSNFLVVDNLMGVTGDTNDPAAVAAVYDGLTFLVERGVPVVMVHHESEKGQCVRGATPMGASMIVQKSRAWIQVRKTAVRKFRGGNAGLYVRANRLDEDQEIIAKPLAGPDFEVITRGPAAKDDAEKPKQDRDKRTLDRNELAARYVVEECQGEKVVRAIARQLAAKLGGTEDSWKAALGTGALSKILAHDGNGGWSLAGPLAAA